MVYSALSIGIMIIMLGFIYWATVGSLDRQLNATINQDITELKSEYQSRGLAGLTQSIQEHINLDASHSAIYLLTDAQYQPINGNLEHWPDIQADANGWLKLQLDRLHNQALQPKFLHLAKARTLKINGGLHLLVGRSTQQMQITKQVILEALAWGMLLTIALSLVIGYLVSKRVMRRLESINLISRKIMQGDFSKRIEVTGNGDDFDQLAEQLNLMLERIEYLMQSVRQVADNIAHDLRTPLSRLHTRLQQLQQQSLTTQSQVLAIDDAIADVNELLASFNALLRIARIESGSSETAFKAVDMNNLLRDIAEIYEPVAQENKQQMHIDLAPSCEVKGDRDLLFQLLVNLVENAIKHTPAGSQIYLCSYCYQQNGKPVAEISVADSGLGIDAGLHEKVFQRFYRTDASRSTPGSGLGLSLVKAIADIHHAKIQLEDNQPGLKVLLNFDSAVYASTLLPE